MKRLVTSICIVMLFTGLTAGNRVIFYHNNYGMIAESVSLSLEQGINTYTYADIPPTIDFNTVMLLPLLKDAFSIKSQNFASRTITDLTYRGDGNINFLRLFLDKDIDN